MSRLENAILAIVEVFEDYSGEEGKKRQLSTTELQKLLETELSSPAFQDKVDPEDIQAAMSKLDKNHDGEANFREFARCVSALAMGYFKKKHGKGGKKGK